MDANREQQLIKAVLFATEWHGEQKRKYTGEPYVTHPVAVSEILKEVTDDLDILVAAILHDVIEDTEANFGMLMEAGFGLGVTNLVLEVTDVSKPSDGNRAVRKELDRQHLAKASARGQTLKLADLLHNTESICEHGRGFTPIYMHEVKLLLEVLTKGNEVLYAELKKRVGDYFNDPYEH